MPHRGAPPRQGDPGPRAGALAELFVQAGRLGDAVTLLADSITLNGEKGSPIGLAFNRRALGALANAAAQVHGPEAESVRGALEEVETRLAQTEAVFGRLVLPGETCARDDRP